MKNQLKTVLLLALPASGKSEVRRFLDWHTQDQCRELFGMGETVQLDDYPYVHMMRRVDEELLSMGEPPCFFVDPQKSFVDPRDWGTLIELLNEDYEDLKQRRQTTAPNAASWLMDRYIRCRKIVDATDNLSELTTNARTRLETALQEDAAKLLQEKNRGIPSSLEGKTVVIEFARGGKDGASMPLKAPFGYAYSIAQLSDDILENASILYIWVTPEQSRQKNEHRADPNDPGSILHHGVPIHVMLNDYGCDDMAYLLEQSGAPNRIQTGKYSIPTARFDNREDLTTFVRRPKEEWSKGEIDALRSGLKKAFDELAEI